MSRETTLAKRIIAGARMASRERVEEERNRSFTEWLRDKNGFAGVETTTAPIVVREFGAT